MKLKILVPVLAILVGLLVLVFLLIHPKNVSMLLVNGVVHTLNEKQPIAAAIAVDGGNIVAVGSTSEIQSTYVSARVFDLKGKAVYPGFIDSHGHLESLGAALMNLNLTGAGSIEAIQDTLRKEAAEKPPGSWIRGRGWDQNRWLSKRFPTHQDIDAVTGIIPTYLVRVDGHAVWVNNAVLKIAGIDRTTPDPEGGRIMRDPEGNPTGVFVDNAIEILNKVLPAPNESERRQAVLRGVAECVKNGLTEMHDMGVDLEGIAIYKDLIREGNFPFRVYVAIGGVGETWEHYLKIGPEIGLSDGRLTVRAIKLYADGALGSRGAALIEPYSDDPTNRGLTLTSAGVLKATASAALEKGFQVCVHAIGDRGNNIVLNVYEDVLNANKMKAIDARFRVEHAQVLDPSDIGRFQKEGVIPVMQAAHCTSDMPWAEERLGPKRVLGAYAWRSLLEHGSILPGGSDTPVENPNPLWGFYAAITRQDQMGRPVNGWHPEQRMTKMEALKSYTIWGANAGFQEGVKGSLEPGKWADIVVLSKDIMEEEPAEVLETTVEMTIIAGQIVYVSGKSH